MKPSIRLLFLPDYNSTGFSQAHYVKESRPANKLNSWVGASAMVSMSKWCARFREKNSGEMPWQKARSDHRRKITPWCIVCCNKRISLQCTHYNIDTLWRGFHGMTNLCLLWWHFTSFPPWTTHTTFARQIHNTSLLVRVIVRYESHKHCL